MLDRISLQAWLKRNPPAAAEKKPVLALARAGLILGMVHPCWGLLVLHQHHPGACYDPMVTPSMLNGHARCHSLASALQVLQQAVSAEKTCLKIPPSFTGLWMLLGASYLLGSAYSCYRQELQRIPLPAAMGRTLA